MRRERMAPSLGPCAPETLAVQTNLVSQWPSRRESPTALFRNTEPVDRSRPPCLNEPHYIVRTPTLPWLPDGRRLATVLLRQSSSTPTTCINEDVIGG